MQDYNKILKPARLRTSTSSDRTILTESESDRGRVLFSPAFRRLQQKAQVFSMEPNAAVRSRLTHSLEVSQLGRFLADEICMELEHAKSGRLNVLQQGALVNFVETACLMHDIGNPPFGHFGEAAIQNWFENEGKGSLTAAIGPSISNEFIQQTLADFLEFDGNPQGVRIVSRLQWNTDEFGLNLTMTTLASFLKYVRSSLEQKSEANFRRKIGFFKTEVEVVKKVWDEFQYAKPQRFPLAYIMEAADDIAYCISDLEDSLEKGVIVNKIAFPAIVEMYEKHGFTDADPCHVEIMRALDQLRLSIDDSDSYTFTNFRTTINSTIVRYVARNYVQNEDAIFLGEHKSLLPEDQPPGFLLNVLKNFCRDHVYTHVSVQRVEMAGYNAIVGLLDQFKLLLDASRERFMSSLKGLKVDSKGNRILLEPKLLKLFPEKYLKVYRFHVDNLDASVESDLIEWNARAHLITDFISGMTDDFAMTTYRTLAGMEI